MSSFFDSERLESIKAQHQRAAKAEEARKLSEEERRQVALDQRDRLLPIASRAIRDFPAASQQVGLPLEHITVKTLGIPHGVAVWGLFTYNTGGGAWWTYYVTKTGAVYEDFNGYGMFSRSSVEKAADALYKRLSKTSGTRIPDLIDEPLEDAVAGLLERALKGKPF